MLTAKVHVRSLRKAEILLNTYLMNTKIRYGVLKRKETKDTGFLVFMSDKQTLGEVLFFLKKENHLTDDISYLSQKYYA